jgi:hypothetical protein
MLESLEVPPDQTAPELLIEFRARYPERYNLRKLNALQRRDAVQRLMWNMNDMTQNVVFIAASLQVTQ